ncbi:MAG: tRNA uridine-5-carboxymethylaminomethyl(34) synthesis GTPase MnmE [Bacteroidaceae bacterium]|nr:tRNA uridine-5-carboxymethylaminomethyl(34) synthesis GTPase MnmE [Bacteroidaceae bacterium]
MSTICAVSTAQGGAIGVIRISGEKAFSIADKVFTSKSKRTLSESRGYTAHFGYICDNIDEVIALVYHAPYSYTGEDSVEFMCHGSSYILQTIIQVLIKNGCEMAKPGEFTQRAYLNGKMDLCQAEAVADLISSSNQATHRMAMNQMRGGYSQQLHNLRNQLLEMTSLLELEIDFSEEDVEFADREKLRQLAQEIDKVITKLIDSFKTGNALKNGVPVAIIGETNVGKSTLLNRLLNEEKAIVSNIHGTTRDTIEDTTTIQGVLFRFIDTAGIRNTDDTIESLGIQRSWNQAQKADIILLVTDKKDYNIDTTLLADKKIIKVYNKSDINNFTQQDTDENSVVISAKNNKGIEQLENLLVKNANLNKVTDSDIIITNIRHIEALQRALDYIKRVTISLHDTTNISSDIISLDLRACIDALAEITGDITSDDTLHNIFKNFCVGK